MTTFWKMLALAAPLALGASGPGQEKLFGNWAVVCDNVKRCQATVLMPESWEGEEAPGLDLGREAGPVGAVTVTITPVGSAAGIIDILIDRRLMGSGVMRDGSVHLTGATAEGIARAIATGRVLTLKSRRTVLASISLTGSSAAMRYFDAEQGRAGGVTALVAKGPKSAATVPGGMPLPKVPAVRPGKGRAATLTPAQTDPLRKRAGCDDYQINEGLSVVFHRLDGRSTLVLIPCISGAYQASYAVFVATGGQIAPAPFDVLPQTGGDEAEAVPTLVDPEWDSAKGSLNSHAKGRGLGDCGVNQEWVWDGSRFRMIFFNGLDSCRLSGNWLTRYRATAVYK